MFLQAISIWPRDREEETNLTVQFKALCPPCADAVAQIATSGLYNLHINGCFVAFGPARAGKGHFRLDRIPIGHLLTQPQNSIVIEVCGCYAYSFEVQKQPSFLQAEVVSGTRSLVWTGRDFTARIHPFRRRKTQRYSFQRVLSEAYNITRADSFLTDLLPGDTPLSPMGEKSIIPRRAPYPLYEVAPAQPVLSGTVSSVTPEKLREDRAWLHVSADGLTGWPIEELEVYPTGECQHFRFTPDGRDRGGALEAQSYRIYRLPHEMSGFLRWRVHCRQPMTLYVLFDELMTGDQIDYLRLECANVLRYDLCAGTHELQTANVYVMGVLQMTAIGGGCTVSDVQMVQYRHPPVSLDFDPGSEPLRRIARAAVETFRQNAVDIFMDCPSRERAGWLCDSFFTGRVAHLLTGNCDMETGFLENFLHEEHYAFLPEGMFPMCYPADHRDGVFIPQWAMWLVLELEEYRRRGGQEQLLRRFRPRVEKLFSYLDRFKNEDGLLESLDGWNFVEWSMANRLTRDVNYPTNMLYSAALRAAGTLYSDTALLSQAEQVMDTVRRQSYDGQFFVDNALRRDGKPVLSGERTEVCQYYAFFFGAATADTHPELLRTLVEDFGPDRVRTGKWPQIHPANAFIGNYLRLDILMQLGYQDTVRENIEGYFLYMADKTGTLWENVGSTASCNHGFASYVLYWLRQLARP